MPSPFVFGTRLALRNENAHSLWSGRLSLVGAFCPVLLCRTMPHLGLGTVTCLPSGYRDQSRNSVPVRERSTTAQRSGRYLYGFGLEQKFGQFLALLQPRKIILPHAGRCFRSVPIFLDNPRRERIVGSSSHPPSPRLNRPPARFVIQQFAPQTFSPSLATRGRKPA